MSITQPRQRPRRCAGRRPCTSLRSVRGARVARARHACLKKTDSSLRRVGNQASSRVFGLQELDA
eukprot:11897210-Heterocapsa_arctica.AAC.1